MGGHERAPLGLGWQPTRRHGSYCADPYRWRREAMDTGWFHESGSPVGRMLAVAPATRTEHHLYANLHVSDRAEAICSSDSRMTPGPCGETADSPVSPDSLRRR